MPSATRPARGGGVNGGVQGRPAVGGLAIQNIASALSMTKGVQMECSGPWEIPQRGLLWLMLCHFGPFCHPPNPTQDSSGPKHTIRPCPPPPPQRQRTAQSNPRQCPKQGSLTPPPSCWVMAALSKSATQIGRNPVPKKTGPCPQRHVFFWGGGFLCSPTPGAPDLGCQWG